MNGFITKALFLFCLLGGLTGSGCCPYYQELVDPCWPERYRNMARKEVFEGANAQTQNGHILDQTVWNNQFDAGTAKLTPAGLEHLQHLARRRPCPDTTIYLQTAQDGAPYDPNNPERYPEARAALNAERVASVQRFLNAETAGRNIGFNVVVHDPAAVELPGITANNFARVRVMGGLSGSTPTGGAPTANPTAMGTSQAWQ